MTGISGWLFTNFRSDESDTVSIITKSTEEPEFPGSLYLSPNSPWNGKLVQFQGLFVIL